MEYVEIFIIIGIFQEHNEHNDQDYYWPTIYSAGATVMSTITRSYHLLDALFLLNDMQFWWNKSESTQSDRYRC